MVSMLRSESCPVGYDAMRAPRWPRAKYAAWVRGPVRAVVTSSGQYLELVAGVELAIWSSPSSSRHEGWSARSRKSLYSRKSRERGMVINVVSSRRVRGQETELVGQLDAQGLGDDGRAHDVADALGEVDLAGEGARLRPMTSFLSHFRVSSMTVGR